MGLWHEVFGMINKEWGYKPVSIIGIHFEAKDGRYKA